MASVECWVITHKHSQNLVFESEVIFPVNQGIWSIWKGFENLLEFCLKKDFRIKASKAEQLCHQLSSRYNLHSLI